MDPPLSSPTQPLPHPTDGTKIRFRKVRSKMLANARRCRAKNTVQETRCRLNSAGKVVHDPLSGLIFRQLGLSLGQKAYLDFCEKRHSIYACSTGLSILLMRLRGERVPLWRLLAEKCMLLTLSMIKTGSVIVSFARHCCSRMMRSLLHMWWVADDEDTSGRRQCIHYHCVPRLH